ncbi:hypothetical protein HMPREF0044_1335 [Gleimia coleocanis DSM 15436]|uniref:DUF349 domain-containing protein n=1 Tax=Gleimia coleocanis DSM 15436 TaxID=525245 RepID=C0W1P5_9ACTO|nr:DUF349 domain-containing protein [Gleimia coleocanis]EEH63411.1 hypothetical protein HMPREF0044_1335 [Gleimia coleocanis DSM 15436]
MSNPTDENVKNESTEATALKPNKVVQVVTSTEEEAAKFGRVDESGNVWVREATGERQVGSYPDGLPQNPLGMYVRRFLDLEANVNLFETRLHTLSVKDIESTLASLTASVVEPAAVGDLDGLRERLQKLTAQAEERKEAAKAERKAAKEAALAQRSELVEAAEKLAAQDPEKTQWKQSSEKMRQLLDQWKELQRRGPRLDRSAEDSLWKRFSTARTTLDRHRRQYFSALDARQSEARRAKEALIVRAEELQSSTDWGATAAAYRGLLDEWKQAGRATHKEDDALWARFRAAQQVFFDARRQNTEAVESELRGNLEAKEALLAEAEALLPVSDLTAAQEALRSIQDRWEEIGRVPRADVARIEGGIRAVESAVHEAEEAEWRRSNPETKARATGMLGQLEDGIADLEAKIAAESDSKKLAALQDALATKRQWFEQISSSID